MCCPRSRLIAPSAASRAFPAPAPRASSNPSTTRPTPAGSEWLTDLLNKQLGPRTVGRGAGGGGKQGRDDGRPRSASALRHDRYESADVVQQPRPLSAGLLTQPLSLRAHHQPHGAPSSILSQAAPPLSTHHASQGSGLVDSQPHSYDSLQGSALSGRHLQQGPGTAGLADRSSSRGDSRAAGTSAVAHTAHASKPNSSRPSSRLLQISPTDPTLPLGSRGQTAAHTNCTPLPHTTAAPHSHHFSTISGGGNAQDPRYQGDELQRTHGPSVTRTKAASGEWPSAVCRGRCIGTGSSVAVTHEHSGHSGASSMTWGRSCRGGGYRGC